MTRNLILTLALSTSLFVAGCNGGFGGPTGGRGGNFDADSLNHLFHSGQHAMNANNLSEKDEPALGQSISVAITNQYPLTKDQRLQHYVMLVGFTVASASPNPAGNWVFGVIDTPEINAFSAPGGYVFITRGAIAQMQDEAELAGVLGHEISHVCHHDGLQLVKATEARVATGELLQAGKQNTQLIGAIDGGFDSITKTGYSKPQEFDADKSGVEVMTAAGYDPVSYLRFLQRLQAQPLAPGAARAMSTHPGLPERIARITKQLQSLPQPAQPRATLPDRFAANVAQNPLRR